MSEPLCPFGDGRHKRLVWQDAKANRSGLSCVRCHKTWEWVGDALISTWDLMPRLAEAEAAL